MPNSILNDNIYFRKCKEATEHRIVQHQCKACWFTFSLIITQFLLCILLFLPFLHVTCTLSHLQYLHVKTLATICKYTFLSTGRVVIFDTHVLRPCPQATILRSVVMGSVDCGLAPMNTACEHRYLQVAQLPQRHRASP